MLDASLMTPRAAPGSVDRIAAAKVLVADDAELIRYRIAFPISELGHQCIEASNGLEAVDLYKRQRPAAVFLDVSMPIMDGFSALSAILEVDPRARVTMVTGMGQRDIVVHALSAGAVDFIVKPFRGERLLEALARMLESPSS